MIQANYLKAYWWKSFESVYSFFNIIIIWFASVCLLFSFVIIYVTWKSEIILKILGVFN